MKLLLVSLQSNIETIGLKYVLSYLRSAGTDVHVLFLPTMRPADMPAVLQFVRDFDPEIIGVSLMSESFDKARLISSEIKKECPRCIIVWGGIHPSIATRACLDYADYVFVGEAERSFSEFVQALAERRSPLHIRNLAFKRGDEVVLNPLRPPIRDLDRLPFPEHHPRNSLVLHRGRVVPMDKRLFVKYARYSGRSYNLLCMRGCPFSCSYCCNSFLAKLYGKAQVRKRSVGNVMEELKWALRAYPDMIYVLIHDDDFFAHDTEWIEDFADRYKKEIDRGFVCGGHPANITGDKIRALKSCGLSWICVGLQSGSPRVKRDIYKRSVSNEALLASARLAHAHSVAMLYDVILDNPFETEEDMLQTVDLVLSLPKPYQFQLYSLTFYEGTEIHGMALEKGICVENPCEKNYTRYKRTYLNKIVRLCPLLPRPAIRFLVNNRNSPPVRLVAASLYPLAIVFVEPLVWSKLILVSFDWDVIMALAMIKSFLKTGFRKLIIRGRS
jgi:radical SAM superfamily enzyme YgiQ (UPF0313 family)